MSMSISKTSYNLEVIGGLGISHETNTLYINRASPLRCLWAKPYYITFLSHTVVYLYIFQWIQRYQIFINLKNKNAILFKLCLFINIFMLLKMG